MRPRCLLHPEITPLRRDCARPGQRDHSTIAARGQTCGKEVPSLSDPHPAQVQIWAAGTGGGHVSVARALASALESQSDGRVTVALDDPTNDPIGRTARSLARAYGPLVRTSPALWGMLFRGFSLHQLNSGMDRFLLHQLGPAMAARTRLRAPRVIVNCHPLLGSAAQSASRSVVAAGRPPAMVTVLTDLVGGHRGWLSPRPDAMLTATAEATDWCLRHGLPASLIRETGLPIDPALAIEPPTSAERIDRRRSLGLDPNTLCVLVGGGAEGAGNLRRLIIAVGATALPLQVVVACGNNRRLLEWLRRHPLAVPTVALASQASLTPWFQAADIYLGKAGPSTLAEAAAAGMALLVTDSLPGQEEKNAAALVAARAGLHVHRHEELRPLLARLVQPADPLLDKLQRGARAWARPRAAMAAAEVVLSFLEGEVPASLPPGRSAAGLAGAPQPQR